MSARRSGHVIRIEVTSAIGCAVIGGLFELAGGTIIRRMAIVLFGWSVGWAFHLATVSLTRHNRTPRSRR